MSLHLACLDTVRLARAMDAKDPSPPSTAASSAFDPNQLHHHHHHHHHQHVYPMRPTPAPWPLAPLPPPIDAYPYNPQQINPNYPSHLPPQPYPTPAPSTSPSVSHPSHIIPYVADANPNHEPPPPAAVAEPARPDTGKNSVSKPRKPRKANNGPGGRSTLFWVHTDPQSVSEGTREETLKRIRSHVMSEHNRKKRMENTKRHNKGKTWKHLAFQPVETTASSAAGSTASPTAPHPSPSKTASPNDRKSPDSSSPSSSPEQGTWESPEQAVAIVSDAQAIAYPAAVTTPDGYGMSPPFQPYAVDTTQSLSPYAYLGAGAKDPFSVMHTQLTDRMMRHLQHFLYDLTIQAYPLQRRYGLKLQSHWSSLVQHDPACLQATICVAATNTALAVGEFPLTSDKQSSSLLLLDTFHHRGETIRLVNEGLSSPPKASSDELIAAVSILLTIEIASGNPDYLKVHLAGLRQMVSMRNSFTDVPPDVRFQISWTDIRVACMALTKPIFPFVRYARPAHVTLLPPHDDFAHTASRLIELVKIPGILGDAMSKIVFDLLELVWYAEWIKGSVPYQEFDDETELYFNTEVLYVEYALHTDRYLETGEPKNDATIEGCVRLACLLFHNSVIWDFYPQIAPVFPKPILALRKALETTIPAGYFHLCEDLLIWLLFIGSCSSGLLPDRAFFVAELASAVRRQGVGSWQALRALLLNFYYVDRVYLTGLRGLWDEIHGAVVYQA